MTAVAVEGQSEVPEMARRIVSRIMYYTKQPNGTTDSLPTSATIQDDSMNNYRLLVESSHRLFAILEPSWQQYLALPQKIYTQANLEPVDLEELESCLIRYEEVAANPAYASLTSRQEFQLVLQSLRQTLMLPRTPPLPPIDLPPPPSASEPSELKFPG